MRILMLAAWLAGPCSAAVAQTADRPASDPAQPSRPSAADKDRGRSSSSVNTPTNGETTGRNNPSISTAPDTAPSAPPPRQ